MQIDTPGISIIVPTYNYGHFINRTLESVINQIEKTDEIIVVDDGSTDNTREILEKFFSLHAEKNLTLLSKPNGGVASARNYGIQHSKGEYLIFLDADDEYVSDALHILKQQLKDNPKIEVVIGGHISIDSEGVKIKAYDAPHIPDSPKQRLEELLIKKNIRIGNLGACLVKKTVFENGLFPVNLRVGEDLPIFAQVITSKNITSCNKPLVKIYKHNDSLRHQIDLNKQNGIDVVDEIFSKKRIPSNLESLKKPYLSQRYLSLFRAAYRHQEWSIAKNYYLEALKLRPTNIFRLSYLKKALCLSINIVWIYLKYGNSVRG